MTNDTDGSFTDVLAQLIYDRLSAAAEEEGAVEVGTGPTAFQEALDIARGLVAEALGSRLPLTHHRVEVDPLSGGNTAELVEIATLHAPFVFKLDRAAKKLADEGDTIRQIKSNTQLPQKFRQAWPEIYAVRRETPYAYLMEFFPKDDGWMSLEDRLYPKDHASVAAEGARQWIDAVLELLFSGYDASINPRAFPSIAEDYVNRIAERLSATAASDDRFASRALSVNGVDVRPWQEYLTIVERTSPQTLAPPFSTVVHGDPNPGNVMVRSYDDGSVQLKLIDPKEWASGDYLFDVAKITHFIAATGPVEKSVPPPAARLDTAPAAMLSYELHPPSWTADLVAACRNRTAAFAAAHKDTHWEARYELGMAANLLGLPFGRLKKGRDTAALILFGEGLLWLKRFCDRQA